MVMVMVVMVMYGNGECGTCGRNQQEQQSGSCELLHEANVARSRQAEMRGPVKIETRVIQK